MSLSLLRHAIVLLFTFARYSSAQDLKEQCKEFEALEFIRPYRKAEEKLLTAHYFGKNASKDGDFSVVFAQRGSCLDYKDCFLTQTSSFSTCRALKTMSRCTERSENTTSFLFDNCTRNHCEMIMSPKQTRCMYESWRQVNASEKAKGTCIPDPDDTLLRPRPLSIHRPSNGSHCLLPLPKDSKIFKQIECRDPGNEPWFRWWYNFTVSISPKRYACLLLSNCHRVEDPLDFLCLSGKNAVQELEKISNKLPPESLFPKTVKSSPVITKVLTTNDASENSAVGLFPLLTLMSCILMAMMNFGWVFFG